MLFAPVGTLVPVALRALDRGGVLSIAGIHLSDVPVLNYERELFYEREIRSVTANTRADGEAFLRFAGDHHLQVTTHQYPLAHAQRALQDLRAGRFDGAAVLCNQSIRHVGLAMRMELARGRPFFVSASVLSGRGECPEEHDRSESGA